MIWVTVSSQSCFCWRYRASPSLTAKNIINLISVLTIWWCPCVESSLVLLEEGVCYDHCVLLAKLWLAFALLHFVLEGQTCPFSRYLLTSYFCIPVSLQHWTLLLSLVTSTVGYCFCFGSIPSFFLELFLHWSPVAYWAPTNLGSSSFSILSFCLFILLMGFSS